MPEPIVERFRRNRFGDAPDWPVEWDWPRPDGTVRTIAVTEVPLRDDHGRVTSALGICRDVTDERAAHRVTQQALAREREAIAQLRRVDELRRLFLQAVSHELRTPLTAVSGFAATLHRRLDELGAAQIRDLAGRLDRQADRLRKLLDDLLDIERAGRGVAHLDRDRLDVGALVARVAAEHVPQARVEAQAIVGSFDRVKIERIVVNLLLNARRHAGAGARIEVSVRRDGDHAVIAVDDDGPGIDHGARDRIFEPFEQGATAADAPSPGTGIGLTLVAEFVRLHGGRVDVEDGPLGGARFVVRLPLDHRPCVDATP